MKSKVFAVTLLASTVLNGYSHLALGDTCYDASGSVATENVTSTLQIGNINLELGDESGVVFSEAGSVVGNITGSDGYFTTFLSHKTRFSQGDSFVTNNDIAVPDFQYGNPVRNYDSNGNACSFWVIETISDIPKGTRLFRNVTSVNITAQGYTSSCPGDNANEFTLSGTLCVE